MGDRQRLRQSDTALPIDARGIVGNMKTTALVSIEGTVDFMCYPRIDSPTIFAGLLDSERGGAFAIRPRSDEFNVKQMYVPETNVLLTRFMTSEGVCELLDLMPVRGDTGGEATGQVADSEASLPNCLVRLVRMAHGAMSFRMHCAPRFDYARAVHSAQLTAACTMEFIPKGEGVPLQLQSSVPLTIEDGDARAEFELQRNESAFFVLGAAEELRGRHIDCDRICNDTTRFWQSWASQSTYRGRYREVVMRSALALKLLSSSEHGAIVAAPTFGLAEALDGSRRWDYRYAWIRDAAFSVYALLRLGYSSEARHFIKWIAARSQRCHSDGSLHVVYAVDGEPAPEEMELQTLMGDTRGGLLVGNGARDQTQLDVYGALLDAVYLYNKYGSAVPYEGWLHVTRTVDYVATHWREPDQGYGNRATARGR